MNKLPTYNEVKTFFKNHIKVIRVTMFTIICLYGVAIAYTFFSNNQVAELSDELPENINGQDAGELLKNNSNAVYMTLFIENSYDGVFTNYKLLNEVIIKEEYLKGLSLYSRINDLKNKGYEVNDIINLGFDSTNNTHVVTVSTGVLSDNFIIINYIKESLSENEIELLKDKEVFLIKEPKKVETLDEKKITTEVNEPNYFKYIILSLIVLVFSFIMGVLVAIIKTYFTKEVSEFYTLKTSDEDKIIDLSLLEDLEIKAQQLNHTIEHPYKIKKLVLCEQWEKVNFKVESIEIKFSDNILKINPKEDYEEIIIILQKSITTKKWYSLQRTQLENYNSDIKIILV